MSGVARWRTTGRLPVGFLHRRWYTPPSRRTWSKQHHRIRTPRPMVDRFDVSREQPHKEWWRERPLAPATFFGFPDVTKHTLRGGSLYVEQMDSVTLAVLADKCLKEGVLDPEIWTKFSWRAQQLAGRTCEPDLCYIFRAFARMDWFDQNLLTTFLGRFHRRLHAFRLPDVAVLLEAFANPRFRQSMYLQKALLHLVLLLQHRDDAKSADLARCCAALRALRPLPAELRHEVVEALELLAEALLLRDLSELTPSRCVLVIDSFVAWGLLNSEGGGAEAANSSKDLCWALVRELRGKVRAHGREAPDELATLALAMADGKLAHEDLWAELVHNLEYEAYRLSGPGVCAAVWGAAKAERCSRKLYEGLGKRIADQHSGLSATDCARAIGGFSRAPPAIAEQAIFRGPVGKRALELGLPAFSGEDLAMALGGLARAPAGAWGVEALAGAMLEELHGRLPELPVESLCSVSRSLGYLTPGSREVLIAVFDRAKAALDAAAAAEATSPVSGERGDREDDEEEAGGEAAADAKASWRHAASRRGGPSPRHVAMLCQGIAQQPAKLLPDAPERLHALLPHVEAALGASPTAVTALALFVALARCRASERRAGALDAAARRLSQRAFDLRAPSLVSLSAALAAVRAPGGPEAWAPPAELLRKVCDQLDIKRYDVTPGALGRAAEALAKAGAGEAAVAGLRPHAATAAAEA